MLKRKPITNTIVVEKRRRESTSPTMEEPPIKREALTNKESSVSETPSEETTERLLEEVVEAPVDIAEKKNNAQVGFPTNRSDEEIKMNRDDEPYITIPYEEVKETDIQTMSRHLKQVFACQWNPGNPGLLASVGADGLGIIWEPESEAEIKTKILDHRLQNEDLEVTALEWNRNGTQLATGDFHGNAYIWNEQGRKILALKSKHTAPIITVKWNKKGNYLLSSSYDKTVILWDASLGEVKQTFDFHNGPVYDVDWKTNTIFASCSGDMTIQVCKLHEKKPLKILVGHTADVNSLRWDPSSQYLASCSDDATLKIWDWELQETQPLIFDLTGHTKPVYMIDWSPSGPKTDNPNIEVRLASASYDDLAKIWSLETGKCLFTLTGHRSYIYSIAYSPDAQFIATGSIDKHVKIWSAKDGTLVRDFIADAGVNDISWNVDSDKLAICTRNQDFKILDFKY